MKKVRKEFLIGLIAVVSMIILYIGMNYLKGVNLFETQQNYFAIYEDIDGLGESNPVVLNGFKIGFVKHVGLHPSGNGKLEVEFVINDKNLKIPSDSKAKITTSDFFGSKAIIMEMGVNTSYAMMGDTLEGDVEDDLAKAIRRELEPLKQKTNELIGSLENIVENLKSVLDDDATKGLPKVFESLQRSMESIEKATNKINYIVDVNSSKVNSIVSNVASITDNLENNNEALSNVIENFSDISDSLAAVNFKQTMLRADSAMSSIASVMQKIDQGQGSLGALINTDSLHNELVQTNNELQYLINDLYQNPWRYAHVSIFGKKPKKNLSKKEQDELKDLIREEIDKQK